MHIRLASEEGEILPLAATGEIVVRADDVMAGYLHNPEATAEVLSDGWLHTGDVGRQDDEGFLYIVGRRNDIIRSGGQSIFPSDVEAVLIRHPSVKDVAVIGTPDPDGVWGELVTAVIVAVDPSDPPDPADVSAFVRADVAGYKVPKRYEFLDQLPRTASEKIAKAELREMFGSVFGPH
jgi:acyl-CoA synthetase (AMP-forming)/AMP-acid ligase II